jgi:hypothetical protein
MTLATLTNALVRCLSVQGSDSSVFLGLEIHGRHRRRCYLLFLLLAIWQLFLLLLLRAVVVVSLIIELPYD